LNNRKFLPLFEKIGDLSRQLNVLYTKYDNENYHTDSVGAYDSDDEMELMNVINFQWTRLNFMMDCVQKIDADLINLKNDLKGQMCDKCKEKTDPTCPEDFLKYVKYCLVSLYDP